MSNKSAALIALAIGALVLTGGTAQARRHGGEDDHVSRHSRHRHEQVIFVDQHRRYAYIDQFGNMVIVRNGSRGHHDGESHHHHRGGHHRHSGHK